MSQKSTPERMRGVFSQTKTAKIGTGTTARKTEVVSYFLVEEREDGVMLVQALTASDVPFGPTTEITREELLQGYLPEPQKTLALSRATLTPQEMELQKAVARGDKFRKRGESFTAEYEYNKALAMDERNVRANFGIGLCYISRGEGDKAKEVFERVVKIDAAFEDEHKHLFNEFGISLRKAGMHAEAMDYYRRALDLSRVRLEVPYEGQKIYWMPGEERFEGGLRPILVPVQFVYLFCNLEEQSLFSALGSTGLASGNTLAEAKVHALCESLERDAEAVTPFDLSRCFRLTARDERVARLLSDYEEANLHVWFMDCTSEFGVPCYKAVVLGRHGDVNKGMGAHLSGPRAVVSAMTEIPYPFPGPATLPAPEGLPVRVLEELPDHSSGSAEGDLMVLEQTLAECGYPPSYVDLTRADLGIPAVRAVIPGLEWVADFDRFSRLPPRLYANYLRQFGAL